MVTFERVTKSFGRVSALEEVSTKVRRGRTVAFVGPNGSGKTTLIKSLLGLVKIDSGRILVNGASLNGHWQYRKDIGYMPQIGRFPDNLRVGEILEFVRTIRGMKGTGSDELIRRLQLHKEFNKRSNTLSGGTRQKLSAAIALMFDPELLIFDEPTAGLDPVSSTILKERIEAERQQGKTVIITSHILHEIEALADDLVFLMDGRVKYEGTVADMLEQTGAAGLEKAVATLMERVS